MTNQKTATFYALLAVLCWSTVATAFKLSLQFLSPPQLILVAAFTSWVFLLGILLVQGRIREIGQLSIRQYWASALFGLLNPTVYYTLLFYAYDLLPAQEAQSINYSWAIVMSLLAVPLLGQRLSKFDLFAVVVCYLGVLVIATQGRVLSMQFASVKGVVFALISTVVWSLYWIYNKRDEREAILGLCLNFSFALPMIVFYCGVTGELGNFSKSLAWQGVVGGVYVGLVEMGLAFVFWLYAMKHAENTSKIANLIFISPFLSLILIAVFIGEQILFSTVLGLLLIIAGLVVQSMNKTEQVT